MIRRVSSSTSVKRSPVTKDMITGPIHLLNPSGCVAQNDVRRKVEPGLDACEMPEVNEGRFGQNDVMTWTPQPWPRANVLDLSFLPSRDQNSWSTLPASGTTINITNQYGQQIQYKYNTIQYITNAMLNTTQIPSEHITVSPLLHVRTILISPSTDPLYNLTCHVYKILALWHTNIAATFFPLTFTFLINKPTGSTATIRRRECSQIVLCLQTHIDDILRLITELEQQVRMAGSKERGGSMLLDDAVRKLREMRGWLEKVSRELPLTEARAVLDFYKGELPKELKVGGVDSVGDDDDKMDAQAEKQREGVEKRIWRSGWC